MAILLTFSLAVGAEVSQLLLYPRRSDAHGAADNTVLVELYKPSSSNMFPIHIACLVLGVRTYAKTPADVKPEYVAQDRKIPQSTRVSAAYEGWSRATFGSNFFCVQPVR